MLDLGFIHALRRIATLIPKKRQTLLFSATMPKPIREIASALSERSVEVSVAPWRRRRRRSTSASSSHQSGDKPALLAKTLSVPEMERAIVFTRTKHGADKVVRQLEVSGLKAAAIHGNKSQGQRERALAPSATASCASSSPPTSPPAASMSTASAMSCSSTCRTCRRPMSTASAAPRAPAPRAWRSPSARRKSAATSPRSRS